MASKKISETIRLPKSGRIQLTFTVQAANETYLSATYNLLPNVVVTNNSAADAELLQAWRQTKHKIQEHDIQNLQIVQWFRRHYNLNADLHDFTTKILPVKFTAGQLKHFCDCIDRYATNN